MQQAIKLLEKILNHKVNEIDVVVEAAILTREELDTNMLPESFEKVETSDELLIEMFVLEEYLVYRLSDSLNDSSYLLGVLKHDELIWYKII